MSVSAPRWSQRTDTKAGPMLVVDADRLQGLRTLVSSFRVAVLATIAFLAFLMVLVALVAAVYEVSDRAVSIIGVVLAVIPTLITSLIVYLKVDGVEVKADTAARRATVAARRAEKVETKLEQVHDDVLNGPMRQNVKQAIAEAAEDPAIVAKRIETIAKGVQADRHTTGSREAAAYARGVTDTMKRWQQVHDDAAGESPPESTP